MFPYKQENIIAYSKRMAECFAHLTGKPLSHSDTAEALYHAPFVLVSHGTEADPIFCYANLTAQKLWQISWEKFVTMPSRFSAEPDAREAREQLLKQAEEKGFVDNYQGIRITADGRRFRISNCALWNVTDAGNKKIGQAATFHSWEWL